MRGGLWSKRASRRTQVSHPTQTSKTSAGIGTHAEHPASRNQRRCPDFTSTHKDVPTPSRASNIASNPCSNSHPRSPQDLQENRIKSTHFWTIILFPARGYNCMVNVVRTNMNKFPPPPPAWLGTLSPSGRTKSIDWHLGE